VSQSVLPGSFSPEPVFAAHFLLSWWVAWLCAVPGRAVAILAALTLLSTVWFVDPAYRVARCALVLIALLHVFRMVDLRGRPIEPSLWRRWVFLLSPHDLRGVRGSKSAFDARAWGSAVGHTAGFLVTVFGLRQPVSELGRWGLGVVCVYMGVAAAFAWSRFFFGLMGRRLPILHKSPVVARSIAEFWGRRWNLEVHGWLYRHCFLPWAHRRSVRGAAVYSFLVSGLIHAWLVLPTAELGAAASMVLYFLAQGLGLLAERRLHVARWSSRVAQHGWTLFWVLGPSWLFVDPMLKAVGY
jgi:hypothetical protein